MLDSSKKLVRDFMQRSMQDGKPGRIKTAHDALSRVSLTEEDAAIIDTIKLEEHLPREERAFGAALMHSIRNGQLMQTSDSPSFKKLMN